ncbi:MAG: hypothetical protein V4538_06560 [Bacteroidota bacterium]
MKSVYILIIFFGFTACTQTNNDEAEPQRNVPDLNGEWIEVYRAYDNTPNDTFFSWFYSQVPLIRFTKCIDNCGFDRYNSSIGYVDFSFNEGTSPKDSVGKQILTEVTNPITWTSQDNSSSFYCRAENKEIITTIESIRKFSDVHKITRIDENNLWIDWKNAFVSHYIRKK